MSAPSSPQQQSTGTLHRHFNLSVTLHDVLSVGDRDDCAYRDYCAQYRDYYPPVASHSRTSSHSSLPNLVGCSSPSGVEGSGGELPELEFVEHTAMECRKCRPFPTSHGCRPCPFSWPDLRLAARRQHDLCVQIISNDYCPLVDDGTRDFVMYCGARCYSQRRRADTGYDVLDYVKSLKRFKAKPFKSVNPVRKLVSPLTPSYIPVLQATDKEV